ncbi:MAG: hydrolase [Anaerolineae bacterium]|nr:hydrolase [Phycisphaerae bacterium]
MSDPEKMFAYIDAQQAENVELLTRCSAINSGTYNVAGLERMLAALREAFAPLGAAEELIDLAPAESIDSAGNIVQTQLGRAVRFIKRPESKTRVLLNIHYDTVYAADHAFQQPRMVDADTMIGPGVCDAKGGIVVMLAALRAFERSEAARDLGWEVYLNPDEEIGSPGSAGVLREMAKRHSVGLLFEPALPDGSIVGARKGSGNFTAVVRGRAAHAGRDFQAGRSATVALAELITKLDDLNRTLAGAGGGGVTINCGRIEGGGAINVVPDLAIGRFNVRVSEVAEMQRVQSAIEQATNEIARRDGITVSLHGGFASPPKMLNVRSQKLIDAVQSCARDVGLGELSVKSSGGASDGNKLAGAGLAVIDTLGPVGGEIHSDREYVKLSTINQRAKVTALLLSRIASGVLDF